MERSCEKYNFRTKKWTNLGSMNNRRYGLTSIIFDSKIVAIGGDFGTCSSAEVYDATNNTWTKCEGMPVRRYGIAGVFVSGKDLRRKSCNHINTYSEIRKMTERGSPAIISTPIQKSGR